MRRRIPPNLLGDVSQLEERQARLERILQVIGFSPDLPYTLTVNDGTRNRVYIGVINGDYGIKIVDNAGNEVILANGTIVADAIKTGTLDCGTLTVVNLDAGSITTGTFTADRISGGILDCGTMTVQNLDAGAITVGTFVNINGRLSAQAIHGEKIQVGTLDADRIVADSIDVGQIKAHVITTNELAYQNVDGDYVLIDQTVKNRALFADINAGKITAGFLSAARIAAGSITSSKLQSSIVLSGLTSANTMYASGGLSIGIQQSVSGLQITPGRHIWWSGGEGNIENVDQIKGYNDIRTYVTGSNVFWMYSTSGGGDLSFWPYWGDFYCTGTKYFRIKHPDDPENKWLQYVSVESPEVALKIRGKGELSGGVTTITLPHHWELATENYLTTVQVTPLSDCQGLFVPEASLTNTSFNVREVGGGVSNARFCWELTCTRRGKTNFDPEPTNEAEAERIVESMKDMPKTKVAYLEKKQEKLDERLGFRELVKRKYKERTGEKFVDKFKIWDKEEQDERIIPGEEAEGKTEWQPKN